MINYIVARKKNMTDGSIKYYAKVAPVSPVYVNDIAARISKTCTVTEHDVKGVRQDVVDAADMAIEIPQYGTKHSLNVSVSAGIVMWHLARRMSLPSLL